jgi:hypothetical protein
MAPKADHAHLFGRWRQEGAMWHRHCLVGGCKWQQVQSDDPSEDNGLGRALGRMVGIEPDDGMGELLEAVGDVVSVLEGRGLDNASPAEQRLYNAFYVVCPPDLSTT